MLLHASHAGWGLTSLYVGATTVLPERFSAAGSAARRSTTAGPIVHGAGPLHSDPPAADHLTSKNSTSARSHPRRPRRCSMSGVDQVQDDRGVSRHGIQSSTEPVREGRPGSALTNGWPIRVRSAVHGPGSRSRSSTSRGIRARAVVTASSTSDHRPLSISPTAMTPRRHRAHGLRCLHRRRHRASE